MSGAFEGRVAIVTGAGDADGPGFSHARFLAERGARLVVNDFGGCTPGLPVQGVDDGVAEAPSRASSTRRVGYSRQEEIWRPSVKRWAAR